MVFLYIILGVAVAVVTAVSYSIYRYFKRYSKYRQPDGSYYVEFV